MLKNILKKTFLQTSQKTYTDDFSSFVFKKIYEIY